MCIFCAGLELHAIVLELDARLLRKAAVQLFCAGLELDATDMARCSLQGSSLMNIPQGSFQSLKLLDGVAMNEVGCGCLVSYQLG